MLAPRRWAARFRSLFFFFFFSLRSPLFVARPLAISQSHRGHPLTPIDYWHGNTLSKTFGWWYSTWAEGECKPDDPTQGFCSWQLTEVVKKIGKTCSDDAIDVCLDPWTLVSPSPRCIGVSCTIFLATCQGACCFGWHPSSRSSASPLRHISPFFPFSFR